MIGTIGRVELEECRAGDEEARVGGVGSVGLGVGRDVDADGVGRSDEQQTDRHGQQSPSLPFLPPLLLIVLIPLQPRPPRLPSSLHTPL